MVWMVINKINNYKNPTILCVHVYIFITCLDPYASDHWGILDAMVW